MKDLLLKSITKRYFSLNENENYVDKIVAAVSEKITGIITTYLKIQSPKIITTFVENPFSLTLKIYSDDSNYLTIVFDRNFSISENIQLNSDTIDINDSGDANLIKILYAITNSKSFLETMKVSLKEALTSATNDERNENEVASREEKQKMKTVETPGLINATPLSARGEV